MYDIVTVTVNYKMKDKIVVMLRSLFRDIEGTNLKVQPVIVDNGSGDGIEETLKKEFGGRVLFIDAEGNVGFGKGNNAALKKFDATYYFIANPDLVFFENQPRTIERLYQFMEAHKKVGIVAPQLILPSGQLQPSCMRFPKIFDPPMHRLGLHKKYDWARRRIDHMHMKDFDHTKTSPIDWATGASIFCRGSMLKEIGFFDERYFMYFEDTDLCRSFWSKGWPVYYKGDIAIQHGHQRASAKVPGIKSVLLNPLTRIHIKSLLQYSWKWRGQRI
ncbi:MAG: glycosyltransferase family 2 protein [bacterium]|nr:glycosyltransferase family 2 protein [bacterium]